METGAYPIESAPDAIKTGGRASTWDVPRLSQAVYWLPPAACPRVPQPPIFS